MSTSVSGVLTVDERGDVLAIAVAVGEYDLHILTDEMDRLVKRSLGHVVLDKVEKTVLGFV